MIIQCRVCQTKYRFDEAMIPRDGAWVRCTRCQKVFFQHPLLLPPEEDKTAPPVPAEEMKTSDLGVLDETREFSELPELAETRPPAKRIWAWALGAVMIVLVAGGAGLYLYPQYGQLLMKELTVFFPSLASFISPEAPAPAIGPAQVKIVDVKQRFVSNALLGNIRIVEGVAMNASPYPMARIRIKGELFDMIGTPVREGSAFCGNLLTDEELGILSEEQIFRELANPQGSDVPNDKIAPNGTIPFMIIFLREPVGVTRTFVIPVAAERLLSS